MPYEYRKANRVKLINVGKDEKWLQKTINEDPSILGLGDLAVIQRERTQPTGGRIDFLMYEPEEGTRYEIEIMLGELNESHIIRAIEYWDVERTRYPGLEHRAVIIAEEITNRFFNVIHLFNKAIPIIAIQLNAFMDGDNFFMDFVKVLDMVQPENDEESNNQEPVDRNYWVNRASKNSIQIMDKIISLFEKKELRVTYNRSHVALGTTGIHFCWFHLRRGSYVFLELRIGSEIIEETISGFKEKGIEASKYNDNIIKFSLTMEEFEKNIEYIKEALLKAEEKSKR